MNKDRISVYEDILQIYIKHTNVDLVTTYSFFKQAKICLRFLVAVHRNFLQGLFSIPEFKRILWNKKWFYIIHPNNYETLEQVKKSFSNGRFVSTYRLVDDPELCVLPFYSQVLHVWRFPFIFYGLHKKYKKNCWDAFHIIFSSVGLYESALDILKTYKPEVIVFANDHSPTTRALLLAARQSNIPTVYIPHANVTDFFPPLAFDLSLLEGNRMKAVYERCGITDSHIELIGSVKADRYLARKNNSSSVNRIGICTNQFDEISMVREVIAAITKLFPAITLQFRSHPSDQRDFGIAELFPQVRISNAFRESAMDFILQEDMIIAGDSSIHLEAAYVNVLPCYYKFNQSDFLDNDYYGFVKAGLCFEQKDKNALLRFIEKNTVKKENVSSVVVDYNAAIGSSYEGKSTLEAVKYIHQLISREKALPSFKN
ncbi:MAG: hypothetical protein JWM14_1419 [Chitinophagaceae bacterium]|nr:hypothetical protein [Chitinophagaceae bacterium]